MGSVMSAAQHDDDQTVLVTGGTRGIGQAIAKGFARAGWRVIAAGLDPPAPDADLATLHYVELDVTDGPSIDRLLADTSTMHALVNAAGVIARHREFEVATFQHVIDLNLTGTMRVCLAARAKLAEQGGAIVNIASMLSFFGGGLVPAYAASKGGVVQLTKSLAIAWAQEGIRVNAIAPGWIATDMTAPLRGDAEREAALLARTPLGRWGRAEEMVGPVLFLTSPAASFITGATLTVDGGYACC